MSKTKIARRDFIRTTLAASTVVPLGSIPIILRADNHRLGEEDAAAKALGYRHDATEVDVNKYPRRAGEAGAKQFCDNCQLYKAGSEEGWGGCAIFPGKQVAAKGWCNAWISA